MPDEDLPEAEELERSADWRLRKVDAALFRQHQRFAAGEQMDEREHIGDHLDHRRLADRPDVENPVAHRFQSRPMDLE